MMPAHPQASPNLTDDDQSFLFEVLDASADAPRAVAAALESSTVMIAPDQVAGAPSMPVSDSAARSRLLHNVASGAAHDMSNLLCVIGFGLDNLAAQPLARAAAETLESIRAELAYLRALARELQLAASEAQAPCVGARTRLTAWWPDTRALLRAMAGDNATVSANIPWGLPSVALAPLTLTQIAMNLVGNAAHAIAEAHSAAAAEFPNRPGRPGQITLSARLGGQVVKTVRLTVADNGAGMSPRTLAQAFEPTFTTRGDRGGTGLGLAMTRRLILDAGGQVSIESEPNSGTTVTLELPLQAPVDSRAGALLTG